MHPAKRVLGKDFWQRLESTVQPACEAVTCSNASYAKAGLRAIDLYCWWSGLVGFRTAVPSQGGFPATMAFIAEGNVEAFRAWVAERGLIVKVPSAYRSVARPISTFFTFTVDTPLKAQPQLSGGDIERPVLPADVDENALEKVLELILECKALVRVQLGFPLGKFEVDNTEVDNGTFADREVFPERNARVKERVVIGVIDDGAAFAHASLRAAGSDNETRVAIVWNQSRRNGLLNPAHWQSFEGSKDAWYGAAMGKPQLSKAMRDSVRNDEVDELKCYADLRKGTESRRSLRSRESHGAAVVSMFAGSLDAGNGIAKRPDDAYNLRSKTLDDPASRAPVILVDLPYELTTISSGRWMPVSALDGVRFILDQARTRYMDANDADVPVVINISSGSSAGAHDGSSMFESALKELLEQDNRLAVTLAAGNSRLANAHSEIVIAPHQDGEIVVRVPPDKRSETYAEFWPEWIVEDGVMSSDDYFQISISVTPPGQQESTILSPGKGEWVLVNRQQKPIAGLKFAANAVQSVNRPMALLVVGYTLVHEWRPTAPYGNWVVKCHNGSGKRLRIRAWIERDEVVFGVRQPQSAHFVHTGEGKPQVDNWMDQTGYSVSRYDTTSNLANARGAFAVAAGVGGRDSGYVSPYSGGGMEGGNARRPTFIARADRNAAQPGIPTFGTYRSARRHMNGTSIAAPQVARWLANYVAEGGDQSNICVLGASSHPREHPHIRDPQTGQRQVAAGEARWFVDATEQSNELCLGKPP